ncbi:MAG: aspartate dehydrogenase [Chloroflexi bacterium]|nr:aspartate dehydrogenase [Chloroflexota bacterium]
MALRCGLIGFGTIGRELATAIKRGEGGNAELVAVLVRNPDRARELQSEAGCVVTADLDTFLATDVGVVIEAAGHAAVRDHAERILRGSCDLLMCSVGVFSDEALFDRVYAAARETGRRILIPSGGLGGLDMISSGAVGGLDEVRLTVNKPPQAWIGTAGEALALGTQERIQLFEGSARDAARLYPQNVNIAAALALASVGLDGTNVRIYSDPAITRNTHEVYARGAFGEITVNLRNVPSPNPKTGAVVPMSMLKALRSLTSPLVVGF